MNTQAKRIAAASRNPDAILLSYRDAYACANSGDFVPRSLLDQALARATDAEQEVRDFATLVRELEARVAELQRIAYRQKPCPKGCGNLMNGSVANRVCCRVCWKKEAQAGKRTRWDAEQRKNQGENPRTTKPTET